MSVVEVMSSIPGLLLILAVAMIVPTPSIFTIILIIGVIGWTNITRFVRAELLKIRNLEYLQAAKRWVLVIGVPCFVTPYLMP